MATHKHFTINIKPDIVNGDVSTFIADDKTDAPFAQGDILFDWQELQVPKGACALQNITLYLMGEDGGVAATRDFHFVFAKSIDGVAPSSLGAVNAAQTAGFDLPLHLIGAAKLEGNNAGAGNLLGPTFGTIFHTGIAGASGSHLPIVLQGEPESGQNVGFDSIYVACFLGGAIDFSTGVLSTGAVTLRDSAEIAVDTVDARKVFTKGDAVYVHDVDTKAGTVASVTENAITLEAATEAAVANNDEIINGSPIRIIFGFER
jgi:hypothetical protein